MITKQPAARRPRPWAAVLGQVARRPLLPGGLATVTLLALAAPVLSPHLEDAGIHGLPASVPVVRSLLDIQPAAHGAGPGSETAESGDRSRRPFGIKGNGGGTARGFSRGAPPKAEKRNMPFAR